MGGFPLTREDRHHGSPGEVPSSRTGSLGLQLALRDDPVSLIPQGASGRA